MSSVLAISNVQSDLEALKLAQRAPEYLAQQSTTALPDFIPFLSSSESSDLWMTYEKLMISCLRTGDEKSAHLCLERLIKRFSASNERVMGLRGLYQEACAENDAALDQVLQEYENILKEDPTNMPIMKRRISLLQSLARPSEAIRALVELLEASPTDAEAWAELSSLYLSQGLHSQACFCLEEVLLSCPNAWNIHARLGEILYISSLNPANANDTSIERALTEGIRRYCRSIELCDGFLRGYYGLKISTGRLLEAYQDNKSSSRSTSERETSPRLPRRTVQELNNKATAAIAKIVERNTAGDPEYSGYDASEIIAAKALLDGDV